MNISESIMSHEQFMRVLVKVIEGTEKYPSCQKLLVSGIKLIGNDDLMHGLDDLRKSFEMLLKELLHNNNSIEKQSLRKLIKLLIENGWSENVRKLWPCMKSIFQKYQNAFVKHDDGTRITEKDADLCVKQALLLMACLVSKKEKNNFKEGLL